jgi:glutathione S-transferase
MLSNLHLQAWQEAALNETRIIKEDEAGELLSVAGVLAD